MPSAIQRPNGKEAARAFEILRERMHVAMGLCGRTKITDLKPDLIFRAD
jgi:isopentenyl diphosphate isomerase/L-lactate dehydrogenase-like FMN-dependent dehydrogenase